MFMRQGKAEKGRKYPKSLPSRKAALVTGHRGIDLIRLLGQQLSTFLSTNAHEAQHRFPPVTVIQYAMTLSYPGTRSAYQSYSDKSMSSLESLPNHSDCLFVRYIPLGRTMSLGIRLLPSFSSFPMEGVFNKYTWRVCEPGVVLGAMGICMNMQTQIPACNDSLSPLEKKSNIFKEQHLQKIGPGKC